MGRPLRDFSHTVSSVGLRLEHLGQSDGAGSIQVARALRQQVRVGHVLRGELEHRAHGRRRRDAGFASTISAATPDTAGAAMLVPLSVM